MKTFTEILFRAVEVSELSAFYGGLLGMTELTDGARPGFAFGAGSCRLTFDLGDYAHRPSEAGDLYWKIGLTVPHLNSAVAYLQERGWPVSAPQQFQQIGYLCHLKDPLGNVIELLQHGFEGRAGDAPTGHPIASQATLAHITFRVGDIEACRRYLEGELGLRLMSVQPVPDHGFTLYFFSWNPEPLPQADLTAVENREWLWARPYPLLELQHIEGAGALRRRHAKATGFAALHFAKDDGAGQAVDLDRLV